MVDRIDPTNQTSVEYGQSLLERKFEQEEKAARAARKDRKLDYAFQVLGGVDNLLKDQARRRVLERNNQLEQDIIREEAEFNKLQKEFELQTPWRTASSPEAYARQLAEQELSGIWGNRIAAGNLNAVETQDYEKSLKELSEFHLNRYKENRVSALPFETKEEYTADLRAQLNKQVPSGLLDIALRGLGFRGNKQEELDATINAVRETYDDKLRDRPGVKGTFKELAPEVKAALLVAPKQDLSSKKSPFTMKDKNGRDQTVLKVETLNPETGNMDITFEDIKSNTLDNRIIDDVPIVSYFKDNLMRAEEKYRKVFPNAQKAQIHSAITNPNNIEFYDPNIARGFERYSDLKTQFFTTSKQDFKTSLKANFEIASSQDSDNPIIKDYNKVGEKQQKDFLNAVEESANYYEKVGAYNERGTRIPISSDMALALALKEQSRGFKDIVDEGVIWDSTTRIFERQHPGSHELNQRPEGTEEDRNEDGSPKSKQQLNADVIELSETKEFQDLPVSTQKDILQNAANKGADINPELLKAGPRPEGVQLELTGDEDFDSFRVGSEMLLADEVPNMDEAENFLKLDRQANTGKPEFRELTREELRQQNQEERERNKADRDRRLAESKAERERKFSPEGKKERDEKREAREEEIKEYLYKTFIDPERNDISRIQKYVEGTLSKNRKIGSTKGTVGKTLEKYGLENMTREEIKRWLASRDVKTAYSPSDVRAELDRGNPVFVGDYRDRTGG